MAKDKVKREWKLTQENADEVIASIVDYLDRVDAPATITIKSKS